MDPFKKRTIGRTDIEVTCLGLGGASHGNMYKVVPDEAAVAAVEEAYKHGVRYFDVAPFYGYGRAERLFGEYLKTVPRESFSLSTKVGRLIITDADEASEMENTATIFKGIEGLYSKFDFSRDGILRSFEESLKRLQLDRIDILHIHDPDVEDCYRQVLDEAFPALAELRDQGVIKAIGAGMNQAEMLTDFAKNADFDCFLLAGRYTLLDQIGLKELLPLCEQKNISIIIGGTYNSGILATGAVEGAHYNYKPAPAEIMEKTRRIELICRNHGVPLKAAAIQFPFGHPAIATNIPGTVSKERFHENMDMMKISIPSSFWDELKAEGLLEQDVPVP